MSSNFTVTDETRVSSMETSITTLQNKINSILSQSQSVGFNSYMKETNINFVHTGLVIAKIAGTMKLSVSKGSSTESVGYVQGLRFVVPDMLSSSNFAVEVPVTDATGYRRHIVCLNATGSIELVSSAYNADYDYATVITRNLLKLYLIHVPANTTTNLDSVSVTVTDVRQYYARGNKLPTSYPSGKLFSLTAVDDTWGIGEYVKSESSWIGLASVSGYFPVTVPNGGTGNTSLTANNLLLGNGTSAIISASTFQYNNTTQQGLLGDGASTYLGSMTFRSSGGNFSINYPSGASSIGLSGYSGYLPGPGANVIAGDVLLQSAGTLFSSADDYRILVNAPSGTYQQAIYIGPASTDGVKVGFGTETPAAKIHSKVAGSVYSLGLSGDYTGLRVGHDAGGTYIYGVDDTLSSTYESLIIGGSNLRIAISGVETARFSGDNFWLGGISSNAKMTVYGPAAGNLFSVQANSSGDAVLISAYSAGNGGFIGGLNSSLSDYEPLTITSDDLFINLRTGVGTSSNYAKFSNNISTWTANAAGLELYGPTNYATLRLLSPALYSLFIASGDSASYIWETANIPLIFGMNNVEQMRLNLSGLGIGSSTISAKVHSHVSDGPYSLGLSGTTKGLRVEHNSTGTTIAGVDNTLSSTYEKLSLAGSELGFYIGTVQNMWLSSVGLGIGESPLAKLHVVKTATGMSLSNTIGSGYGLMHTTGGSDSQLSLAMRQTGNVEFGLVGNFYASQIISNSANSNSLEIYTQGTIPLIFGTNSIERMRINGSTGVVSISSSLTLSTPLSVSSGGTGLTTIPAGQIMYGNGTSAVATSANLTFSGGDFSLAGNLNVSSGQILHTGTQLNAYPSATTNYEFVNRDGAGFQWYVASASILAMTLNASGNLGIGTTSPSATLHVGGNAGSVLIQPTDASNAILYMRHGSIAANSFIQSDVSQNLIFGTADAEKMRLTGGGDLGIGTTSPSSYLSGTTGLAISTPNAGLAFNATATGKTYLAYGASSSLKLYESSIPADIIDINAGGKVLFGVGGGTAAARIHAIDTSEQLRLGYDFSNYLAVQVDSGGATSFTHLGSTPFWLFYGDSASVPAKHIINNNNANAYGALTEYRTQNTSRGYIGALRHGSAAAVLFDGETADGFGIRAETQMLFGISSALKMLMSSTNLISYIPISAVNTAGFQMAFQYNGSNYVTATVNSVGALSFNSTGTGTVYNRLYSFDRAIYTVLPTTAPQFYAAYDGSNYLGLNVNSVGKVTFTSTGTGDADTRNYQFDRRIVAYAGAAEQLRLQYDGSNYVKVFCWNAGAFYVRSASNVDLIFIDAANNNISVGEAAAAGTGLNSSCFGYQATNSTLSASNEITLGNASVATLRCQVTSITALSDRRDKNNIESIRGCLDFINSLKPVSFDWNCRDGSKVGIKDSGFIAQDLKQSQIEHGFDFLQGLVYEANPEKLEAAYGKLIPVIVGAIQELREELKNMKR